MKKEYETNIETVMVTLNGQLLDVASFVNGAQAATYRSSVRRWAAERRVAIMLHSQVMNVAKKNRAAGQAESPFALAC